MSKLAPESYLNGGYAPGLCAGTFPMRRTYAPGFFQLAASLPPATGTAQATRKLQTI